MDFPMGGFWMCFINVFFKVISNLKFYKRVSSKTTVVQNFFKGFSMNHIPKVSRYFFNVIAILFWLPTPKIEHLI